jgi:hypothetical protein
MKTCKYCKLEKPNDHFAKRKGTTPSNRCRQCQRDYAKSHYNSNKSKYIERNVLYKNGKIKDEVIPVIDALKSKPCADCKQTYPPYVMDFDHLDASTKYRGVADMVGSGHSLENILKEIDKCELVCSNCHRIRTYKRRVALIQGEGVAG